MSRISTGTGDKGQTGLFDGTRVAKSHAHIRAFGDLDELDAILGVAASAAERGATRAAIHDLQHEIFVVKSDLATRQGPQSTCGASRRRTLPRSRPARTRSRRRCRRSRSSS